MFIGEVGVIVNFVVFGFILSVLRVCLNGLDVFVVLVFNNDGVFDLIFNEFLWINTIRDLVILVVVFLVGLCLYVLLFYVSGVYCEVWLSVVC